VSAEVLLVPSLGVWEPKRASQTVPAAILTLEGLGCGRRQDWGADLATTRGLPGELKALGTATQLREVATEKVCAAMLAEALYVLGRPVWYLLVLVME
jgi:hypothetical protein